MTIYARMDLADLRALLVAPHVDDVAKDKVRVEIARREGKPVDVASPAIATVSKRPTPGKTATGVMNKTEERWAAVLDADPTVKRWWYEEVKVRIGEERAWYTPDFFIEYQDGTFGFDEVKGRRVWQHGRARFQAAARIHRWARFRYWQWEDRRWTCKADYPRREVA